MEIRAWSEKATKRSGKVRNECENVQKSAKCFTFFIAF